ncbi:MAG: type II toxin-antitoxin system VapC family toxin [Alphaproteobacteria bacterium]|nr:type II toxin-antitoxin system VapC family toxin [Alphaproteobacteria bacterium]
MSFLLDTNVVSESRRPHPDGGVVGWVRAQAAHDIYISALTLGEIAQGVALRARRDLVASRSLVAWLATIRLEFDDRVLPITGEIAEAWGQLQAKRPLPVVDALLAATALVHELTLVTRNIRDFEGLSVPLENPWQSAAG